MYSTKVTINTTPQRETHKATNRVRALKNGVTCFSTTTSYRKAGQYGTAVSTGMENLQQPKQKITPQMHPIPLFHEIFNTKRISYTYVGIRAFQIVRRNNARKVLIVTNTPIQSSIESTIIIGLST